VFIGIKDLDEIWTSFLRQETNYILEISDMRDKRHNIPKLQSEITTKCKVLKEK
jgi:hypothetical protein